MKVTITYILKILSQTEISLEDLSLYLNVDKNMVLKTITQIDEFLQENNFPLIHKNKGLYHLALSNDERDRMFNNFFVLTPDERVDYLYIKFITYRFLNLEKEKEFLDISRSTIIRTFQHVRGILIKNGTEYEYIHGKGLGIKKIGKNEKKSYCKKVMKLFTDEKNLVPPLKTLFNEIKKFDIIKRTDQIYRILKLSNKYINYILISYIVALEVCVDIFDDPIYEEDETSKTVEYIKIKTSIDLYGDDFNERFKKQLAIFLTKLNLDYSSLDLNVKQKTQTFFKAIKKKFKLKNMSKNLRNIFIQNIYFSFFKFENKILKNRNINFNEGERKLLNILEKILEENSLEMFIGDKFLIILELKKMIIEDNISKIKKVLLLFEELNVGQSLIFKENLMRIAPEIKFDLYTSVVHKYNLLKNIDEYDLIVSDEKIDKNTAVMRSYSDLNLQNILLEEAFKVGLEEFEG